MPCQDLEAQIGALATSTAKINASFSRCCPRFISPVNADRLDHIYLLHIVLDPGAPTMPWPHRRVEVSLKRAKGPTELHLVTDLQGAKAVCDHYMTLQDPLAHTSTSHHCSRSFAQIV